MKERPILFNGDMIRAILDGSKTQTRRIVKPKDGWLCPYGLPGDRLWARETWAAQHLFDGHKPREISKGSVIHYRSTEPGPSGLLWRPSIFMPRWASRIDLEIINVRLEKVKDIAEEDARDEGVKPKKVGPDQDGRFYSMHRHAYIDLWNSINEKRGYGWAVNPLVWVLEF